MYGSLEVLYSLLLAFITSAPHLIEGVEAKVVSGSVSPSLMNTGDELDTGSWGLPDAVTTSGVLFQYALSSRTIDGVSTEYKISDSDFESLPNWLFYNETSNVLEGVATPDNAAKQTFVVQVSTQHRAPDGNAVMSKEHFIVRVTDNEGVRDVRSTAPMPERKLSGSLANGDTERIRAVHCHTGDSVTTAIVVIDTDIAVLSAKERVALLRKSCEYLGLPFELVHISTATANRMPMFSAGALVAGPGDTANPQHPGVFIRWNVGCGNVLAQHMPVLELLEVGSHNGSMGRTIGFGIVGWHITNKRASAKRQKRQARYNVRPTDMPMPSHSQPNTFYPVPTMTITETPSDSPSSRPILAPSSPAFSTSSMYPVKTSGLGPKIEITVTTSVKSKSIKIRPTKTYLRPEKSIVVESTLMIPTMTSSPVYSSYSETTWTWPELSSSIAIVYPSTDIKTSGEFFDRAIASLPGHSVLLSTSLYDNEAASSYSSLSGKLSSSYDWNFGASPSVTPTLSVGDTDEITSQSFIISSLSSVPAVYPTTSAYFEEINGSAFTDAYTDCEHLADCEYSGESFSPSGSSSIHGRFTKMPQPTTSIFSFDAPTTVSPSLSVSHTVIPTAPDQTESASQGTPSVIISPDTSTIKSRETQRPPKTPRQPHRGDPPLIVNSLPPIMVEVGKLFLFRIPENTFLDHKDGPTRDLTLFVLTEDDSSILRTSWIQFNVTSQSLYGQPLLEHVGSHSYILVARDSDNKITKEKFDVLVVESSASSAILPPSHEFSIVFDMAFERLNDDVQNRLDVSNKIAKAFGDNDANKITVRRIQKGSAVFVWTNNTLPSDPCPIEQLSALFSILNNKTFDENLSPYKIIKKESILLGSCVEATTTEAGAAGAGAVLVTSPSVLAPDESAKKLTPSNNNLLIYIILGIIILAVTLLVLVMICIVCYKKQQRRRQKQQDGDKISTLHKGIPIIFADELEDRPADDMTPGSTLKSVRGGSADTMETIPPPEYPRSKTGSTSSTLRSDWKAPLLSDNDDVTGDDGDDDGNLKKKKVPTATLR